MRTPAGTEGGGDGQIDFEEYYKWNLQPPGVSEFRSTDILHRILRYVWGVELLVWDDRIAQDAPTNFIMPSEAEVPDESVFGMPSLSV